MQFAYTEEQDALRESVRRFIAERAPLTATRSAMTTERGYDPELWAGLCEELGLPAICIPEELGGFGFGMLELSVVQEELGRGLVCSPFFSTVCLAVPALLAASDEVQERWLEAIAGGESTAAVAVVEADGRWEVDSVSAMADTDDDGFVLFGTKCFVLDGHTADLLLVAARRQGEVSLYAVPADAEGLTRTWTPSMDQTRRLATLTLDGVRVPSHARIGDGWSTIAAVHDRAVVALAAEQVGVADTALEMAVDYAKVRKQFGRAIGTFQAIQHKCADMLVAVETAKSAAMYAAWAADAAPDELPLAASQAGAWCSDAAFRCAADNLQIHGGIGFTWEHDAHLFFKRAQSSRQLLGSADAHRERFGARMGW